MAVVIPGTLLLVARTTRSQAYVQALAARGLRTEHLFVYGDAGKTQRAPDGIERCELPDLFVPDLTLTLEQAAIRDGWQTRYLDAYALDDPGLVAAIRDQAPRLIVFSGYPAQMVPPALTQIAPVLHCHSGALPRYRGSTTLYYALLEGQRPAVSALLVDAGIDSGRIVAMQDYAPPPPGADIDHLFDGAIRADLLTTVLAEYARDGSFVRTVAETAEQGQLYFIVHPVLKHIALASLGNPSPCAQPSPPNC